MCPRQTKVKGQRCFTTDDLHPSVPIMTYPRLAAIAVVIHEDQVLLVRRMKEPDAGLWGFPGGHVEWGETALAAAARELAEETGVIAAPERYLTNVDVIVAREDSIQHHFLLAAVQCSYQSGVPQAADDVSDARWFNVSELGRMTTSANVDAVVRLATTHL